MKNFNKIKEKKICPAKSLRSRGFVILFSVMLSSILLAITLGVANISYKEIKFGTSAKDANNAFFAADNGIECALYYDKTEIKAFDQESEMTSISCGNSLSELNFGFSIDGNTTQWGFTIMEIGSSGKSCVKVDVDKSNPNFTKIISKGYNIADENCDKVSNTVEREIEVTY